MTYILFNVAIKKAEMKLLAYVRRGKSKVMPVPKHCF